MMELQIGFGDVVRVGHVVVDGGACQAVGAGTVFLGPADRGVDRHNSYMDTLRHRFPCHTLRESSLGLTCHRKGAAQRESFEGAPMMKPTMRIGLRLAC
jgi:hypothetical protein